MLIALDLNELKIFAKRPEFKTQDNPVQTTPLHRLEPHTHKAADRFTFPSDQLVRKKPKK